MLDVQQRSGVTIVRLSHGKVNALDLELVRAIAAAMRDVPAAGGRDHRRRSRLLRRCGPAADRRGRAVLRPGVPPGAVRGLPGDLRSPGPRRGRRQRPRDRRRLRDRGGVRPAPHGPGEDRSRRTERRRSLPASAMEIMRYATGPPSAISCSPRGCSTGAGAGHRAGPCIREADVLLDSALDQAQKMRRTPADVFSFSKRQLQQPARDRIAALSQDDAAVLAMWSSARTRDGIAAYLNALKQRPR